MDIGVGDYTEGLPVLFIYQERITLSLVSFFIRSRQTITPNYFMCKTLGPRRKKRKRKKSCPIGFDEETET